VWYFSSSDGCFSERLTLGQAQTSPSHTSHIACLSFLSRVERRSVEHIFAICRQLGRVVLLNIPTTRSTHPTLTLMTLSTTNDTSSLITELSGPISGAYEKYKSMRAPTGSASDIEPRRTDPIGTEDTKGDSGHTVTDLFPERDTRSTGKSARSSSWTISNPPETLKEVSEDFAYGFALGIAANTEHAQETQQEPGFLRGLYDSVKVRLYDEMVTCAASTLALLATGAVKTQLLYATDGKLAPARGAMAQLCGL